MKLQRFVVIFLLSMTIIGLELAWTRIFSAEFFYTFSFLVLSLAILGLGLGALALHLFPSLNNERVPGIMLSLTALFTLMGPPAVFILNPDFSLLFNSWLMVGKLLVMVVLLSAAYFTGGIALTNLFRRYHNDMPKLYMADLLGAGLGVVMAVLLMNLIGTPKTTFLIALPALLAAFLSSPKWLKLLPAALFILLIAMLGSAAELLQPARETPEAVAYMHWDAMAKVKVYEPDGNRQMIRIDNMARTAAYKFDGNFDLPDSINDDFGMSIGRLIDSFDSCRFVVIGAGGGGDVMQPMFHPNVSEVHAVEVIPYINRMLVDGQLAEFSGYLYRNPRVRVITEDGRAYIRQFKDRFDIIFSSSSNTFAALSSGAFALAENYLFTTDAFCDYWQALSDSGFLVMEHQVYMPRVASEVMEALQRLGVKEPLKHFAIYDWIGARRNVLVISKKPLTAEMLDHALTGSHPLENSSFRLLYPAADSLRHNIINRIVLNGWQSAADSVKSDISPCTDDRPFIAQMGLWRNLNINKLEKVIPYSDLFGFPLSKMIIVIILLVVTVIILPLNLLPYFFKGKKLRAVPWTYFFIIGMAFMIVEIILIQKYSLFIGPSVYSIVTVLLTLLIASGIGSRFSNNLSNRSAFIGIILWVLLEVFLFGHITNALAGLSLFGRIVATALLVFPLGFFMGMPFPKAALKVGDLIGWGFAVNGAASVLGSTAILLVVFAWGFGPALLIGAFLYAVAFGLITRKTAW